MNFGKTLIINKMAKKKKSYPDVFPSLEKKITITLEETAVRTEIQNLTTLEILGILEYQKLTYLTELNKKNESNS
jgi:hypothetical protein